MTQIVKTEPMGSAWMVTVLVDDNNMSFQVVLSDQKATVWLMDSDKRPDWTKYQSVVVSVIKAAREAGK